ncbi:hypothetical protein [Pseudomonas fontis]|uniref:Lipoprotein n=1 Tax=Pseudomonas fontis TaxID=2942633 RepID=A0ABT5P005_9PSED|nr:hypothetical protein [Pseudomonas fontis]MDD0977089.1 hypothetical protein [Pseudomonas fontis]MDD0993773.1 hypothetical protein [Pseudomonas fontis]
MQFLRGYAVLLLCLIVTGCANHQPPVEFDQQFWNDKNQVIGVAMTQTAAPRLMLTGNQGLLDLAINTGINSKLSDHVSTWDLADINTLPDVIVKKLEAKGYKAKRIDEKVDLSKYKETTFKEGYMERDISALKATYGIDRLLVLAIDSTGATRSYYSIVPTSDPIPVIAGRGILVDVQDSRLLWFKPFAVTQPAQGEWDQPAYSNLSNAFYQALDNSRQLLVTPFAQ